MDNCTEYMDRISELIDGELPPESEKALYAHMDSCESCRRYHAALRAVSGALEDAQKEPPAELKRRIMQELPPAAMPAERKKRAVRYGWRHYAAMAACLALVLLGGSRLMDRGALEPAAQDAGLHYTVRTETGTGMPAAEAESAVETESAAEAVNGPAEVVPEEEMQAEVLHDIDTYAADQEAPAGEPGAGADSTAEAAERPLPAPEPAPTAAETEAAEAEAEATCEEETRQESLFRPEDDGMTTGSCTLWAGDRPVGETRDPAALALLEERLSAGGAAAALPERAPDYVLELPDGERFALWEEGDVLLCRADGGEGFAPALRPDELLAIFSPAV